MQNDLDFTPLPSPKAGRLPMALASLSAFIWAAAVIGAPLIAQGFEALLDADAAQVGSWLAIAFGPALLALLAGAAASEAARSRAEIRQLSILTQQAHSQASPAPSADRAALAATDAALQSMRDTLDALDAPKLAQQMRDLSRLEAEMRGGTDALAQSVGRQIRVMREASRLVAGEVAEAEQRMSEQIERLTRAGALIAEKAAVLDAAAARANAANENLAVESMDSVKRNVALSGNAGMRAQAERRETIPHPVGIVANDTDDNWQVAAWAAGDAPRRAVAAAPSFLPMDFGGRVADANIRPFGGPPDSHHLRCSAASFADLAESAGIRPSDTLSVKDLDTISEAARLGLDARRDAVRACAPTAIRTLTRKFRKDAEARRRAESLRLDGGDALAAPTALGRRNLACAYLLIDAALG